MSNFSYDDFAVLVRTFSQDMLDPNSLRIVPLSTAPSMANAIHGTNLEGLDSVLNLPKQKNGDVVRSNVTVQHKSEGYCRLVGHIEAVKPQEGQEGQEGQGVLVTTAKAFVLYHLVENATTEGGEKAEKAEVIAVASLKEGFEIGDVCYPSFTITTVNNYQSVAFNPNAFATVEDLKNINGLDGLHIAFDTASGDLKLLDKDGNVLDQANLPIKADVIIADGEEGYKYVKTDVKQDIHAAKAWMPEGSTAWEEVQEAPYEMKHAALVVGKSSSRRFVSDKPVRSCSISTKSVPLEHVVIEDSTYLLVNKTETTCHLRKVNGKTGAQTDISAGISNGNVTLNDQSDPITIKNGDVEVDVIEFEGVTCVLVGPEVTEGPEGPKEVFEAQPISGKNAGKYTNVCSGIIVTFGGSTTASKVFVDPHFGSFSISTKPVSFDHVEVDGSTYMVTNKTETKCSLFKVKGKAEAQPVISDVKFSGKEVTLAYQSYTKSYTITNEPVQVDVIKTQDGTTTYVLVGTADPNEFLALSLDGSDTSFSGIIVTSEGTSTGGVVGITLEGKSMYTFEEGATTPSEITSISGGKVRWLDTKVIPEGYTLKYGLEAFVWTVKGEEVEISDPFFSQLNASLLALGFHEGDDIALGTNLSILAPTEGVSPLNRVDADEYMHGETLNESGKTNKELREQEVDAQRNLAKDELKAWNAQHPALEHNGLSGTRISFDGVDIRNGKIEIGNGILNEGEDNVKRYVIETDIGVVGDVARADTGLQIGVMDSVKGSNGAEPIQKDILTINAEDYISGAPTCLALLKCSKSGDQATVSADLEGGRITANFTASGAEADGVFTLTITDNRANNGFGGAPRIVEIIPVYKSGADAHEAVPAQRSISAIAQAVPDNENRTSTLSIRCSQVIDWAQSIDLDPVNSDGNPVQNDMELYLIVKVY